MKQKKYFILAAAAALFAACSSDDLTVAQQEVQAVTDNAVAFDAYTYRASTRAGAPGSLTTDGANSTVSLREKGFGVFAYYTDNNNYDQQALPNFMYNQQVTYPSGSWTYDPVKYWPNEYGDNAISDDADKISFFAYAPYVHVTAATGKPDIAETDPAYNPFGIQSLSRNTATGDPIVKYQGTFATNFGVDLCWGVCDQDVWPLVQTGQNQTSLEKGKPWLDVQRPADPILTNTGNQRLKFTFKHATAKLNVQIDHFTDGYDNTNPLAPNHNDSETRIFIRSITFTGFAMEGALNLNNTDANKPLWLSYCCDTEMSGGEEVTIYDGRKDGKEGVANAVATNEKVLGLNPQLVQTEDAFNYADPTVWSTTATKPQGVTNTLQNLFAQWDKDNKKWAAAGAADAPIYVIPTDDDVEVEIVYDVETIDKKLSDYLSDGKTHGSTIQNRIRKKINFGSLLDGASSKDNSKLEPGKAYTIQLHLGMNSVKFDAVVTPWEDMEPGTDIDLPANMPQFAAFDASADPYTRDADIPGYISPTEQDWYVFAVTGLTGGETVTASSGIVLAHADAIINSTSNFGATGDGHANASGVVYVKAKAAKMTGVKNSTRAADITITGASGKKVQLKLQQLAVALNLTTPAVSNGDNNITLERQNGFEMKYIDGTVAKSIRIWRNNAELVLDGAGDKGFSITEAGVITLNKAAITDEEFRIVIKTGDVPEETVSFKVS